MISSSVLLHLSIGKDASILRDSRSTPVPQKYSSSVAATRYTMKHLVIFLVVAASAARAGHFYNADGTPYDAYHDLHLPHEPPLYPTFHRVPRTGFTCRGLGDQLWSDVATGCQAYHLCQGQRLLSSNLCGNGTLFNQQFQVCDQFYNVRCGSPYEDL